ncbi:MAG: peptidylprolyl isomerase, partial [Pseudomonadota bacterium]|nr:peptidylprolyl isomerase [Pseudomonadota bacterium]
IDETLDRIKSRQGQIEYRLSEILLAVDGPEDENNVMRTANRFREQINNGASFSAIARQFSQSATAAVGGDLGWLHGSELTADIRKLLPELQNGLVSKPIKTVSGYRLVALQDSRKIAETNSRPITLDLRQIFLPFSASAQETDIKKQLKRAAKVRNEATGCQDFGLLAEKFKSSKPPYLGRLALKNMSPAIRAVVSGVSVGSISEPVKMPSGILLLMVCGREGGKGQLELPKRNIIAERIIQQRLSMMARRYLRDIRLSAVIDIRV